LNRAAPPPRDDRVGLEPGQCLRDRLVPDRVAGEVQRLVAFEDEPGDRSHPLGPFPVAVTAGRPVEGDPANDAASSTGRTSVNPVVDERVGLGGLAKQRDVRIQLRLRRVVEVIGVAVGNDHRVVRPVDVWHRHEGFARSFGGVIDRRQRALRRANSGSTRKVVSPTVARTVALRTRVRLASAFVDIQSRSPSRRL